MSWGIRIHEDNLDADPTKSTVETVPKPHPYRNAEHCAKMRASKAQVTKSKRLSRVASGKELLPERQPAIRCGFDA